MRLRRRRDRPHPPPELAELERLADSIVELAQQTKSTVADLRRQDIRGDGNDPAD